MGKVEPRRRGLGDPLAWLLGALCDPHVNLSDAGPDRQISSSATHDSRM